MWRVRRRGRWEGRLILLKSLLGAGTGRHFMFFIPFNKIPPPSEASTVKQFHGIHEKGPWGWEMLYLHQVTQPVSDSIWNWTWSADIDLQCSHHLQRALYLRSPGLSSSNCHLASTPSTSGCLQVLIFTAVCAHANPCDPRSHPGAAAQQHCELTCLEEGKIRGNTLGPSLLLNKKSFKRSFLY